MSTTQTKTESQTVKRLAGKVAIVTGGSRGIGAAIAKRLADEGANVAITYEKNKDAADLVVASIAKLGNGAVAIKANAAAPKEVSELVNQVERTLGKIDILVNNAGVYAVGPIDQVGVEQYDHIFDVNVKGVIATTIAVLPMLKDGGRIINISSGAAEVTLANFSIYSASKAALDTLTRIWAQELGARRITVNGVAPGTTVTDMFNEAMGDAEVQQQMVSKTALGRLGQPEDIAAVVAFLASEDGGWVTGQTIRADGGLSI